MSASINYSHEQLVTPGRLKRLLWVSPLAMVGSIVANLGLYYMAGRLFPEVAAWSGAGAGQIIGATIVFLLMGTAAFVLVVRFSTRPARYYAMVATVGLILSLATPLSAVLGYGAPGAPAASVATAVTLSLMHVMAFAISVPLFIYLALDR